MILKHGLNPAVHGRLHQRASTRVQVRQAHRTQLTRHHVRLLKHKRHKLFQVLHHQISATCQGVLHHLHRIRHFEWEEVIQARSVEKLRLRDPLLRMRTGGQVAGAHPRRQRLAQPDQLADDTAGVLAGVIHNLAELCQAVICELTVIVSDGLGDVLSVLSNLITNVVNLLSQLTMAQHSGRFVHRKPPRKQTRDSNSQRCYSTSRTPALRRAANADTACQYPPGNAGTPRCASPSSSASSHRSAPTGNGPRCGTSSPPLLATPLHWPC